MEPYGGTPRRNPAALPRAPLAPTLADRLMVFGMAVAATAVLLASAMYLVHGRPRASFSFRLGHAAFLVPFLDVLSLPFLFVRVLGFASSRHVKPPSPEPAQAECQSHTVELLRLARKRAGSDGWFRRFASVKCVMKPGDIVHTSFGKGIVREVRNSGRVLAEVKGRAMELGPDQVSPAEPSNPKAKRREEHARPEDPQPGDSSSLLSVPEVDLHGLTVDEALARAALALNNAILANVPALRFIHGRSGGRIRGALQRWLGSVAAVRGFRLAPRNPGVTIVRL